MTRVRDYLKAYYRVCRLEYLPGEIPAVFAVLFLGSASVSRFFELPVIEGLVAFMLLYLSGFIINALADKEIDQKYDTFKTSIPKSVDLLGEKTLKAMITAHVVIAIILALHITMQMGSFVPIGLVLLGLFFGLGYSVRPFHFKVKGVWHAIALGSSAFFLPFIFLMFVVTGGNITLPLMIFILGFSFVHYGMEFGNQAIDYIEDRASNVRTPPVRWGMVNSLKIALGCIVLGIIAEGWSLYHIILAKGSFTYVHPMLTTNIVFVAALGIILAGYYIPIKGLWKMHSTLKKSDTIEEGMPVLKKICNYAKWQTSGVLGVAIASAILFMGVVFSPMANIISDTGERSEASDYGLHIASPPEVEFYNDDEGSWANVTVSVLNDDIEEPRGSIMIWIESWTANFRFRFQSVGLEDDLMPNEYWNVSKKIRAHDVDDTTIIIYLYALTDQHGLGQIQIGDPWVIPSQKDLYIYDVIPEVYEVLHNKKANVTVNVFNHKNTRGIGELEVKVRCWTSYWILWDEQNSQNNITIHADENWVPVINVNVNELDIGDPIFEVILFHEGEQIDYMIVN